MSDQGGELLQSKDSTVDRKFSELKLAHDAIGRSRAAKVLGDIRLEEHSRLLERGFSHNQALDMVRVVNIVGVSQGEQVRKLAEGDPALWRDVKDAAFFTPLGETFYKQQLLLRNDVIGLDRKMVAREWRGVDVAAFPKGNLRVARIILREDPTGENPPDAKYFNTHNIPKSIWQDNPHASLNVIRGNFYGREPR